MAGLYEQMVLLGDSITEFAEDQAQGFNFAPALRNAYIRRLDVVNRGHSGYTTKLTLRVLPYAIPRPQEAKARFLVIFLGANDACFPQRPPNNQCVPLPEYKENLIKIVQHPSVIRQAPRIIFIAPAPIQESKQRYIEDIAENGPKRTAENTKRYADAVVHVGDALSIPVLDLWTIFATKAGWKPGQPLPGGMDDDNPVLNELLIDGLHFAPAGYRVMFDEFMKLMQRVWPDQMPDKIPYRLPVWNDGEAWEGWPGPGPV